MDPPAGGGIGEPGIQGSRRTNDIYKIKMCEEVLEKYYNSNFMPLTINYLLSKQKSVFSFFMNYGLFYDKRYKWIDYQLYDLFIRLYNYLKYIKFPNLEKILFLMKQDYLIHSKVKPKIWWEKLDKKKRTGLIELVLEKKLLEYNKNIIYKYSIIEVYKDQIFIILYLPKNTEYYIFN